MSQRSAKEMNRKEKNYRSSLEPMVTHGFTGLISRFMKGQYRLFLLAGLMLIFEAATAVLIPLGVAYVIDYLTVRLEQIGGAAVAPPLSPLAALHLPNLINPDFDTLLIATAGIVLATMINSLGDSMAEIYLARTGQFLGYKMRVSLYEHLQKLSLTFHTQKRTGDILSRVTSDVAAVEDFVISSLSDIVGSLLLIIFILVTMLLYAWQVALVAFVIIPIMALISNYFTQRIKSASKKQRASEGELASAAQEMLTSIRVIQTYGLGSYEQSVFAEQSQKAVDAAMEAARLQARFSWMVSVLGAFSTAAVIWMAVFLIFRSPVIAGVGLLTAFIKYIQDMFKPTKKLIQEWNTFGKLAASVERINDIFNLAPAVQDKPGAIEAPTFQGHIEFRNVNFSYQVESESGKESEIRMALRGISFDVEPGQVLAVVGHTGAGKSTIVQLLPRLYDPTEGQILIDSVDIREYTVDSLRAQMSMVLQESILFSGSVVENIAYGRPEATGAEIINASTQANAHEFIEKMPQGYYTLLGERGANLSGGQRQRISIARAFIRNTPILILDEPSTGLDAESTSLVLHALKSLMKGKTTIIISHDLNLIRDADKIIVIKDGMIEQVGTHQSLLEGGGLYAVLYHMQYGLPEGEKTAAMQKSLPEGTMGIRAGELLAEEVQTKMQDPSKNRFYDDLPHSPALHKRLPALAVAFDGEEMRSRLQESIFGQADPAYTIETCIPGKAIYLPGNICNMRFDLEIKDTQNGQVLTPLINARLFPELPDCQAYARELMPLAARGDGREEFLPFTARIAMFEDLKMAVSVFPIDGAIPTLVDATDPVQMIDVFQSTLPEALSGSFVVKDYCMEVAHYGRLRRCVLRYQIEGQEPESETPQHQMIYGKVDADGTGALTMPVIAALRERLGNADPAVRFNVPRALGFRPDLQLLLMEALPGRPQVARLLKARLAGDKPSLPEPLTLEDSIKACGRAAAAMHGTGIKLGRRRTFEDEIHWLQREFQSIQDVIPELGSRLLLCLGEVTSFAATLKPQPLCFSHGDFTYTQLVFDGEEIGLVDFDTVCQAEPALDVGQFLAYQRLAIRKDGRPEAPMPPEMIERLCGLFLDTYIETSGPRIADERLLRSRVAVYELISLLRLAIHSWQKLKGNRLYHSMNLVEERLACLAQAS